MLPELLAQCQAELLALLYALVVESSTRPNERLTLIVAQRTKWLSLFLRRMTSIVEIMVNDKNYDNTMIIITLLQ